MKDQTITQSRIAAVAYFPRQENILVLDHQGNTRNKNTSILQLVNNSQATIKKVIPKKKKKNSYEMFSYYGYTWQCINAM